MREQQFYFFAWLSTPGRPVPGGAPRAAEVIASGHADAVTFGRPFIANPDLPERFRLHAALNEPDQSTFYGGDEKGYTDYPFLERRRDAA